MSRWRAAGRARPLAGTEQAARAIGSLPGRVVVAVVVVLWSLPAAGVLITSFQPADTATTSGWWSVVGDPQLTVHNYQQVLRAGSGGADLFQGFLASVAIAVPATLAPLGLAAVAAYAFAWARFAGRDGLFLAVVALALVPLQMTLVPLVSAYSEGVEVLGIPILPDLGLAGSWLGLWLAHTAFALPIAVLVLRGAMAAVPSHLVDAARADGASHLDVFARVVVPLSVPALAAVAALQFLWVWNDFLVASALLGHIEPGTSPITLGLAALVASRGQELHLLSAGTVVTAAVPLVVFVVAQRLVVQGVHAATFDQ